MIGENRYYEPDDIDCREAEEQARKLASEKARYLDRPAELAGDYPADHSVLLQQVFEIMRANRTANLGEQDQAQRGHNNEQTLRDLIALWTEAASKAAEFYN